MVKIDVTEVRPEQLNAGSQGWLNLKIRNIGPENGEMASVKLIRNGNSPLIPEDSTRFIGTFPSGAEIDCRFKITALQDAVRQSYPVDVVITSTNREGTIVTSRAETVGVPVNGRIIFTVTSPVPEIPQGAARAIEVRYRNDGDVTVYSAEARLDPHDPLIITDSNAFLGDLEPGQTAIARYEITSDTEAVPETYTFDSSIRFRDAFGNSQMSDTVPVQITVVPATQGSSAGLIALAGGIGVVIVLGAAFLIYRKKKEGR